MNIEIGKTYLTRSGERITIEAETTCKDPTYRFQGMDERGRITWRSLKGRIFAHPHRLDLIKEA
jgi:hypothetical protein